MAVQGSASSAGFWDLDGPPPAMSRRLARAATVAAVWVASVLPVVLGVQPCPIAALFHVPCPGCGMTRALRLLAAGHVDASLRMHPLAVPVLVAGALLIASTVWATLTTGSPIRLRGSLVGRIAIAVALVVYAATLGLWVLRWFGHFGGPVPVS